MVAFSFAAAGPAGAKTQHEASISKQATNQLLGPLFCGFLEGAGQRATCVDGGKLYHLRAPKEFQDSYEWRKSSIASENRRSLSVSS